MEEDPFQDLRISNSKFLDDIAARTECPKCGRTRKYYCYTCYVPMTCIQHMVPKVKLPIKVDIIKHPSEVDGKSTAVHAAVIASEDVSIYTYPVIPDYRDPSRVILIFPGEKSVTLEDLATDCPRSFRNEDSADDLDKKKPEKDTTDTTQSQVESNANVKKEEGYVRSSHESIGDDHSKKRHSSDEEPAAKRRHIAQEAPFDRVVFIDSTWNQTMKIYKDERLRGLKQVELKSRTTKFWRHQRDKPSSYLATIEAIYFFFLDYHKLFVDGPDDGTYDNLLFFFSYMYQKIRTLYDGGKKLKAYQKIEQELPGS